MTLCEDIDLCRGTLPSSLPDLPETRPSFLDPDLDSEPWIEACRYEPLLVLFLLNRPIALMPGSALDHVSMNTRLDQLRHRTPRRRALLQQE
jgi:hypothetical protein